MKTSFDLRVTTRKALLGLAVAGLAGSVAVERVSALPSMRLTDGASVLTIADNLANDANAADGGITYLGMFGDWSISLSAGTTKPLTGTPYRPDLHLDWAFHYLGTGVGTLRVEFTDTDFILRQDPLFLETSLAGAVGQGGGVTFKTFMDFGNAEFGKTVLLGEQSFAGGNSGASFDTALDHTIPGVRPAQFMSFTLDMLLTSPADTRHGGSTILHVPDNGSPLALLSLALVTLGGFAARRAQICRTT